MYRERKREATRVLLSSQKIRSERLRGGGGAAKTLEAEERRAALTSLTANMLYLENNAQTQFSEVRLLDFSILHRHGFLLCLFFEIKTFIVVVQVAHCNVSASHL